MERIQEALQKARAQREREPGEVRQPQAWRTPTEPLDGQPIGYSRTRVVTTPEEVLRRNRIVAGLPDHPQADVFRVLRTKLLQRMRAEGMRSLAITGPTKGTGKSLVAANLAIAFARERNQTVLLVDMDLRRPSLHASFGLESGVGLVDHLLDGVEIPELLVNPGVDGLVLLPAGRAVSQSSELLSTRRMSALMQDITNRYNDRIIVLDMPPLLGLDDALVLSPEVHASVLVVEENGNTREEIEQSIDLLPEEGFMGVVYNKASPHESARY